MIRGGLENGIRPYTQAAESYQHLKNTHLNPADYALAMLSPKDYTSGQYLAARNFFEGGGMTEEQLDLAYEDYLRAGGYR